MPYTIELTLEEEQRLHQARQMGFNIDGLIHAIIVALPPVTYKHYAILMQPAEAGREDALSRESGYSGYCLDVPAVVATGETIEEVTQRLQEGLQAHIDALRKAGQPIPEPQAIVATVSVAV